MAERNNVVSFFSKKGSEEVASIGELKNEYVFELPDTFFLQEQGFYRYDEQVFELDKEGLYEFKDGLGGVRRHYYFKSNFAELLVALRRLCEFSGTYKNQGSFDFLINKLVHQDENNLPFFTFVNTILEGLLLAFRHIPLYSRCLNAVIFDWVEIWDEVEKKWRLYWLDLSSSLGETNSQSTCFDIFGRLLNGTCALDLSVERKYDRFVTEKEVANNISSVLSNIEDLSRLLLDLRVFPVTRSGGYFVLEGYSDIKYRSEKNLAEKVSLDNNEDLLYKINFVAEEYIRNVIYGEQIYIIPGRYVVIK